MTKPLMFVHATGIVCVSEELRIKNQFYKSNVTVIANGSPDALFELTLKEKQHSPKLHLAFCVASNQSWHGIDKVKELIKLDNDYHLHIIGLEGASDESITFYGKVSRSQLIEILSSCDVGLSGLSVHTKNMNEASSLKSREYLALGLPMIFGYYDTDLSNIKCDFLLQIPNDEGNVIANAAKIKNFAMRVKNIDRNHVRSIVKPLLSSTLKEDKRLAFLRGTTSK
jgi:hypothetical protein